jgi:hypothetical protein
VSSEIVICGVTVFLLLEVYISNRKDLVLSISPIGVLFGELDNPLNVLEYYLISSVVTEVMSNVSAV